MEPRAWVGMNLGRSVRSPGAYNVWVPSSGRIVVSSDVYFDETLYPWRDASRESRTLAQRADGDSQQPPGLPPVSDVATDAALPAPRTLRNGGSEGQVASPRYGIAADCIDNAVDVDGGGREHNVLVDSVYERLLQRCADNYYAAVVASPSCSTFSVSRFFHCDDAADGRGLPPVPPERTHASQRNRATHSSSAVRCAHRGRRVHFGTSGGPGSPASPIFLHKRHAPIWITPDIVALKADTASSSVTFPQCALGATSQKYTTLSVSPGLTPQLQKLSNLRCQHPDHRDFAGGSKTASGWASKQHSAYPPDMNFLLARVIAKLSLDL
eukprot:6191032-Pleurochrysis_carterae.AAC.2